MSEELNDNWLDIEQLQQTCLLSHKDTVKSLAFLAADLILMPSQEKYKELLMQVWADSADMFEAMETLPRDYTEENAKILLDYAKKELIRVWRMVLELDGSHADEAREWLDNDVIGAALAGSRDDEKEKVAEYLDELKEVEPYGPQRVR